MALNSKYTFKGFRGKEGIYSTLFHETCCDIPELVRITLKLGYKY